MVETNLWGQSIICQIFDEHLTNLYNDCDAYGKVNLVALLSSYKAMTKSSKFILEFVELCRIVEESFGISKGGQIANGNRTYYPMKVHIT